MREKAKKGGRMRLQGELMLKEDGQVYTQVLKCWEEADWKHSLLME